MSGVAGGSSPRSTLAARSVETGVRYQKKPLPRVRGRDRRSTSSPILLDHSCRPPDRQPNRGAASSSST